MVVSVAVVGEAGAGKSTIVKGLTRAMKGDLIRANSRNNQTSAEDNDFWGSQRAGEKGSGSMAFEGNTVQLDVAEVIGFRSRMGNSMISREAARNADVIIFCVPMGKDIEWKFYGLRRVRDQVLQVKNRNVKVILAFTQTDSHELTPAALALVPSYVKHLEVKRDGASMGALLNEVLTAHYHGQAYFAGALKDCEEAKQLAMKKRREAEAANNLRKKANPFKKISNTQSQVQVEIKAEVEASKQNEEQVEKKGESEQVESSRNKRKWGEVGEQAGVMTRSAKKLFDMVAMIPRGVLGSVTGVANNTDNKEIAPLA